MSSQNIVMDFLNVVILSRSRFILIARGIACFKVLSLAYFVVWSYGSRLCFRHLTGFASLVVNLPFGVCLLLFMVEVVFWMYSLYKRMLTRMFKQSLLDANRNLLALCTPQLCKAQKQRIQGLNTLTDIGILIWLCIVLVMYAEFQSSQSTTCNYQQDYGSGYAGVTSCVICSLQPLVAAYACFLGVSVGIILKTVVLASHGDFTLQSRVLENILMNRSKFKNAIWIWLTCSEVRQLYSATLAGVVFVPALLLILGGYVVVPGSAQGALASILFAISAIILVVDGGVIFLPWRIVSSLFLSGESIVSLDITSMASRPQRKVVASFLWFLSVPWVGGCQLANMGALGGINNFAAILLLICVILTIFLFLVRDHEISVKRLLKRDVIDNYGLILSKDRMVSEFARILEESKNGPAVVEHQVRIPTYLASQDRIDLSAVISYRWSDEMLYRKKNPNANAPRCYKIRLADNEGFDWVVTIVEPMLQAMVKALAKGNQEYVWMDQFSIPQETPGSKDEHEKVKEIYRNALIPRMIGLYSSGGVVIAFNNTGDSRILEQDWYQSRLWCVQEYSFPEKVVFEDISDASGTNLEQEIKNKRNRFNQLWFRLTNVIRSNQVADVLMDNESGKRKILLDWDHTVQNFSQDVLNRVSQIGATEYLDNVKKLSASNRNDILPALAQAWFGIIMTKEETKLRVIVSILRAYFIASNQTSFDVIVNKEDDSGVVPRSGTMLVDRMLTDYPAGLEKGGSQLVKIVCQGVKQELRQGKADLHVFTGKLLSPAGFEDWETTLQCIRDTESVEEGCKKYLLVKMTVRVVQRSQDDTEQETHEFECL
uniref:Heterokaryon incompatibility domain-containing protein n=1 Tax=Hanusia phi TaxID=3032 RepID=A0A7S0HCV8_9CRYP